MTDSKQDLERSRRPEPALALQPCNPMSCSICREGILVDIRKYNSSRHREEHIKVEFSAEQDIDFVLRYTERELKILALQSELVRLWGSASKSADTGDTTNKAILPSTNAAELVGSVRYKLMADDYIKPHQQAARPVQSVTKVKHAGTPASDNAPAWLGAEGFEQRTTEWFENHGFESSPVEKHSVDGGAEQGHMALLAAETTLEAKNHLLDVLICYSRELCGDITKMNELVLEGLKNIIAQAKGKGKVTGQIQPVDFAALLHNLASDREYFANIVDLVLPALNLYSSQCSATGAEVDEAVVEAANEIIEKMKGSEKGKENPDLAGYDSLLQVIYEGDEHYPRYGEEILQAASERSGVDVETIMAQCREMQKIAQGG